MKHPWDHRLKVSALWLNKLFFKKLKGKKELLDCDAVGLSRWALIVVGSTYHFTYSLYSRITVLRGNVRSCSFRWMWIRGNLIKVNPSELVLWETEREWTFLGECRYVSVYMWPRDRSFPKVPIKTVFVVVSKWMPRFLEHYTHRHLFSGEASLRSL